jgi:hypothetical protein
MFMKLWGLLLGISLLAWSGSAAAQWTSRNFAVVGGWTVRTNLADGLYMNCGAVAPGSSYAAIEKSTEGWTLIVGTKTKGEGDLPGLVDIDGKSFQASFLRFEGGNVGIFLKPAQLKSVRAGKSLTVKVGGEATTVALDGASAALRKVLECNKKAGN